MTNNPVASTISSPETFRSIIESAPAAMTMIDGGGHISLINAETERLFGYTRAELIGKPIEMLIPQRFRGLHPAHRTSFAVEPRARRLGAGRDLFGLTKDGAEVPIEIGLNPIKTDDGLFVLSAIIDISERKRLESAQLHNDELDRRLKERTAELARANEALEKSNVELQQFVYIASHDLQAPLRGIIGFSQLLRKRCQGRLDGESEELLMRIGDGVTRMQTLINDLLTYARVESRSRPFESIRLNDVVDDVLSLLDSSLSDSGAEVTREDLPVVSGDRPQLVQLLQNLIGNAIKYHGDRPPRVHISAARSESDWIISIRDNGIGIDRKHHERIFEIFRRLHTAQAYPGTGIGLAVCRRIVTRHHGRIWVESEPGLGSTFHFTINGASGGAP